MIDSFIFGAYWESRAEALAIIAEKSLETLQKLGEIDEQFITWYETGVSRKKALEKEIELDIEYMERVCLKKVKQGELDKNGFSKLGFLFNLWTGQKDEEASSISFIVGGGYDAMKLNNSIVLKVPYEGGARERLLQIEKARLIMSILIGIWNPDYAVLISESLRNVIGAGNKIGWLTYHKTLDKVPETTKGFYCDSFKKGYLLTLLTDPPYDVSLLDKVLCERLKKSII
ncbi:Imm52 family immunity protein [Foetidibacter luteolus]|uniref:Imm52 family immunity protein n=1 Tax=Foetidibacter luteolus TaxID=2608880 RepID=UPI00129A29EB|nr:Imm52 family immunity protein [Foetidibacter luteolus]